MTAPVIAALYGGLNALILIWLTAEVVRQRQAGSIILGDGGDPAMTKLIRGHGNAAETIPLAIVLLTLAELIGAPGFALHIVGVILTFGRVMHALHFTGRAPSLLYRTMGMAATLIALVLLSLGLVGHALIG
ncbi:MAG: MAPEG family protein [Pseudomonadota bacterium]